VELDIVALLTNTTPGMAFGLLAFWYSKRDHADIVRREQAFSTQLTVIVERQMATNEKIFVMLERIERNVHELKNAMQKAMPNLDSEWRSRRERGLNDRSGEQAA
jgi:hypothetical protein